MFAYVKVGKASQTLNNYYCYFEDANLTLFFSLQINKLFLFDILDLLCPIGHLLMI